MNNVTNYIMIILFGGMAVWLGIGYFRTRGKITVRDKMWSSTRIMFMAAGVLGVLTIPFSTGTLDYVRMVLMLLCVVMYFITYDGIGDEGICVNGSYYPYNTVRAYDYQQEKKSFYAVFTVWDSSDKKNSTYNVNINFDLKNEEAVKELLKKKIGKKYKRMRK